MSYISDLRAEVGSRALLVPGGRAVVQNDQGQVLFHRRSDLGIWDLPGGGAEIGESLEACVVREVQEETGLIIEDFVAIGLASDPVAEHVVYPNGDVVQGVSLILFVTRWRGDLTVSDESTELRFWALDSLPQLRPNIAATIDCYHRYQATAQFQLF